MRNKLYLLPLVIFMLILLGLTSCSTLSKKDGPPPFDVDVSKIPDAIPKAEKMSKYGNPPSYNVFGRRYHVMNSSKNYHARGIASWYGSKFHKQRTSSGEPYNMLAMTAAHKTLPLPTYVRVTNVKNAKSIIVKVNDRGPFESNRLIDLSYAAAKKLQILGKGTAMVDVEAIDPAEFYRNNNTDFDIANHSVQPASKIMHASFTHHSKPAIYLQLGSFKNRIYAEHLTKRISTLVHSQSVKLTHSANHRMYRVQVGPIKNTATAKQLAQKLHAAGLKSHTVVQPDIS